MPVDSSPRDIIVELRAVSKTYGHGATAVHALRSIDLEIAAGEMTAIMGTSGSGKSTMLNILGTLDRPSDGLYRLAGDDVTRMSDAELAGFRNRKIGFVFQAFNLLPRYTAQRNVELPMLYGGVPRAERRRRAADALARVGLAERAGHLPSELSGGQQQRVSIARALVQRPVLLLADEPTGALDSATSRQVMELFRDLHREGMTIVLVTHDEGIASYAARVLRFSDGRIVSDERKPAGAPAT